MPNNHPPTPRGPMRHQPLHWISTAEINGRRWGLGIEFACGDWWPREWSVTLMVGPLLFGAGLEEDPNAP